MASPFHDIERAVSAACDETFGERTSIVPQLTGGYVVAGPDPMRAPFEARGVVHIETRAVETRGSRRGEADTGQLQSPMASVSYAETSLVGAWRAGDLIQLLDRAGQPVFRVSRCDRDGMGRIIVTMLPTSD